MKYDISGIGSVSAMFENRNNTDTPDGAGKAQVIGGTFTYSAIKNVSFLVGYAGIMNNDAAGPRKARTEPHRRIPHLQLGRLRGIGL